MIRRLAVLGLLLLGRLAGAQAPVIRVDDAGPGVGPKVLVDALRHPYTVAPQGVGSWLVARTSDNPRSLVVLGRDVIIEGHVHGDVIVISGDLYMHPGGVIDGRAIAYGGGVYQSSLATIGGGPRVFGDFTYDVLPVDGGVSLRYRPLTVAAADVGWSLPGIYGIASPEYDRSDGLAIGFAPRFAVPRTALVLEPKVTYRSQLGEVDPSLALDYRPDRRTRLTATAERATRSNDRWIRTDLLNALDFLWNGNDTRNYYRATSAEARLSRLWESVGAEVTPYVGARFEDAQSVRPGIDATGGPWTFLGRDDEDRQDRLRFNPPIDRGRTASALAGGTWRWSSGGFIVRTKLDGEIGVFHPTADQTCVGSACVATTRATFGQATLQGHLEFPTFAQQLLAMDGHFVATTPGTTPRQRYAYFGGTGTIPMLDLLSEGGDELVYIDGRYVIPVRWFTVPFLGSPAVTLRELLGGAAVGKFPTIHQAIGARLALKVFYVELLVDPDTRQSRGGFGVSLTP